MCLLCFISHLLVTEVRGEFFSQGTTLLNLDMTLIISPWGSLNRCTITVHPNWPQSPMWNSSSMWSVFNNQCNHRHSDRNLPLKTESCPNYQNYRVCIHCSCLLSYFSASMVTVAALISRRRIRKRFPLTIMMHQSFMALCAVFPEDFDNKEAWQMDDIRAGALQGDWNLIFLHNLSQKIIIHVPKQVLK